MAEAGRAFGRSLAGSGGAAPDDLGAGWTAGHVLVAGDLGRLRVREAEARREARRREQDHRQPLFPTNAGTQTVAEPPGLRGRKKSLTTNDTTKVRQECERRGGFVSFVVQRTGAPAFAGESGSLEVHCTGSVGRAARRGGCSDEPARRAGPCRCDGIPRRRSVPGPRTSDGGGRSPGSRVAGRSAHAFPVSQWRRRLRTDAGRAEDLTADSCGYSCGFGANPAPHSLLAAG